MRGMLELRVSGIYEQVDATRKGKVGAFQFSHAARWEIVRESEGKTHTPHFSCSPWLSRAEMHKEGRVACISIPYR